MSVLAKVGNPAPVIHPVDTDRIPAQRAAAAIAIGDMCSLGAGGWSPASAPGIGLRMAANVAAAGDAVTLWNPGTRVRYAAPAGSSVVPGTVFYLDATTAGALNSTSGGGFGLADPTTAPTLSEGGAGALGAGDYTLGYTDVNATGESKMSTVATVTLGASKKLHVAALAIPATATGGRNWYLSRAIGSGDLAYAVHTTDGAAFDINALPAAGAAGPPDTNTTVPTNESRPLARALANSKGAFEGVIELL